MRLRPTLRRYVDTPTHISSYVGSFTSLNVHFIVLSISLIATVYYLVQSSFVELDAEAEAEVDAEAEAEAETDADAEYELDAEFEVEAEDEEAVLLQISSYISASSLAPPKKIPGALPVRSNVHRPYVLTHLPMNGLKLPPLPRTKASSCLIKAKEFLQCNGGTLSELDDLSGDELKGFCLSDYMSSRVGKELTQRNPSLAPFDNFFNKVGEKLNVMAPTHNDTERYNEQQDHVKMCFLPGSLAEGKRWEAKGQYYSTPLGESSGLYRPVFSVRCGSAYCTNSGAVPSNKPQTMVLNFSP